MNALDSAYFANLWMAANWISFGNRQSELVENVEKERERRAKSKKRRR